MWSTWLHVIIQGVPNRWNRWSMGIDGIRWQSMPINRLILIIDEQSIVQVCVIIDCHRLASIVIDCRYQSINWHRLSSIININRLIGIDFLPILSCFRIVSRLVWGAPKVFKIGRKRITRSEILIIEVMTEKLATLATPSLHVGELVLPKCLCALALCQWLLLRSGSLLRRV